MKNVKILIVEDNEIEKTMVRTDLEKPYNLEELLRVLSRSISYHRLSKENVKLKKDLGTRYGLDLIAALKEKYLNHNDLFLISFALVTFFSIKRSGLAVAEFGITSEGWKKSVYEAVLFTIPVMGLVVLVKWLWVTFSADRRLHFTHHLRDFYYSRGGFFRTFSIIPRS